MKHDYILIVDDDPGIHQLLGLILRPLSFNVKSATSGQDALGMIGTDPPRLIILDLSMPGISGFDVLSHLAEFPATSTIPVVIFSGNIETTELSGHEWPAQVTQVLAKSSIHPAEFREIITEQMAAGNASAG